MMFLIYGEDTYRAKNLLTLTRERFRNEKDPSGMNVVVLRAEDGVGVPQVHEVVLTPPFLGEKKMVILQGFLLEKKEMQDELVVLMERLPECCVVVFYESVAGAALEKSVLFSLLKDQKYSQQFLLFTERQAIEFVEGEFKVHGVVGDEGVAARLVQNVGRESWMLLFEAKKLAMYVKGLGREVVTCVDVVDVVGDVVVDEAKVFDFTDAYVVGDQVRSLRIFRSLVLDGTHPLQLTSLLLKQFRVLLVARAAMDNSEDVTRALSTLKVHQFVAMKARRSAERVSLVDLRRSYARVIAFDAAMKSSAVHPEDALCASFV